MQLPAIVAWVLIVGALSGSKFALDIGLTATRPHPVHERFNETSANHAVVEAEPSLFMRALPDDYPYSNFRCIGSSQKFWVDEFQHNQWSNQVPSETRVRVCLLKNVCLIGGRLTYYEDPFVSSVPDDSRIGALAPNFVWAEHRADTEMPLVVKQEEMPAHLQGVNRHPAPLWTVNGNDWSESFGHNSIDFMLPPFIAMDLWGLSPADVHMLHVGTCDWLLSQTGGYNSASGNQRAQECRDKLKTLSKQLFDNEIVYASQTPDMCMRTAFVGQSSAFGVFAWHGQVGGYIPRMRDHLLPKWGIHWQPPRKHRIFAMQKTHGALSGIVWQDVCGDTRRIMASWNIANISDYVELDCFNIGNGYSNTTLLDQARRANEATIILSDAGSAVYISYYAADGTTHLGMDFPTSNKDRSAHLKENQQTLFWSRVQFKYMKDVSYVDGMLRAALLDSSQLYKIPMPPFPSNRTTIARRLSLHRLASAIPRRQ